MFIRVWFSQKSQTNLGPSINGRTSQRKSYSGRTLHIRRGSEEERFFVFTRKGQPPQTHVAEAGCNLSRSSWYLAKISVREPCALQKNNKHVIQHSKARASCIDQQSEKTYSSSITRAYLNVVLRSQRKQTKLKRALKSKSVSSEWFLFFSPFFIIVSLSSHFRVAMINYEHIPTVFHFPCMNYRQS